MEAYGFIYVTTNEINGMRYIGKKNYDSLGRWKQYLGSGIRLQNAVRKYGKENFSREIIAEANTPEELNVLEQLWIAAYNADKDQAFYNIASGGEGGHVTAGLSKDEQDEIEERRIEAIRKSNTGGHNKSASKLSEAQVLQIIQRLLNNTEYLTDIAKDYRVSTSTIEDILLHRTWKFLTHDICFPDYSKRKRPPNKREVYQYTKDGKLIDKYESAREAERATGVGFRLISQVCNGDKPTAHGYVFSFVPI